MMCSLNNEHYLCVKSVSTAWAVAYLCPSCDYAGVLAVLVSRLNAYKLLGHSLLYCQCLSL